VFVDFFFSENLESNKYERGEGGETGGIYIGTV